MSKSQSELKGMERKTLRDVEDAADEYIATCDKLKRLAEDKKEGANKLIVALRRNKITKYVHDGHLITLHELEKIKVATTKDEDADDD